jgi:hypothetical protein
MSVARSISAQPPASDADLLLGMGRGTGARHTDQQGSADVGILSTGLIIFSLAPCAPFLPMVVSIARADMNFAAAVVPLISVGTVVFIPLLVPLC